MKWFLSIDVSPTNWIGSPGQGITKKTRKQTDECSGHQVHPWRIICLPSSCSLPREPPPLGTPRLIHSAGTRESRSTDLVKEGYGGAVSASERQRHDRTEPNKQDTSREHVHWPKHRYDKFESQPPQVSFIRQTRFGKTQILKVLFPGRFPFLCRPHGCHAVLAGNRLIKGSGR